MGGLRGVSPRLLRGFKFELHYQIGFLNPVKSSIMSEEKVSALGSEPGL
jgi:hypothetical protein